MKGFLSFSRGTFRLLAATVLACGIVAAETVVATPVSTSLSDSASTSCLPVPATLAMVGGALVVVATLVRKSRLSGHGHATGGAS